MSNIEHEFNRTKEIADKVQRAHDLHEAISEAFWGTSLIFLDILSELRGMREDK